MHLGMSVDGVCFTRLPTTGWRDFAGGEFVCTKGRGWGRSRPRTRTAVPKPNKLCKKQIRRGRYRLRTSLKIVGKVAAIYLSSRIICGSTMERSGMGCSSSICRALAGAAWPPSKVPLIFRASPPPSSEHPLSFAHLPSLPHPPSSAHPPFLPHPPSFAHPPSLLRAPSFLREP